MTQPADLAALFRDVVAAGTRHQRTLADQSAADGLVVHCSDTGRLPAGAQSPYQDNPDRPGPFLVVDPAGPAPAAPTPDDDGNIPADELAAYQAAKAAWEAHRRLYNELFTARTPSEYLELVVAVGRLDHETADGERHQRHLVAAPAEIELDQATQRLTVSPSDAFRVEHNWLAGPLRSPLVNAIDDRNGRSLLDNLADDAETYNDAAATWRRALSIYGQDATWEADDPPPGVVRLSTDPVVLLRRKDTSHLLALLTDMADDLTNGGYISGPLQMLADLDAHVSSLSTITDRPALPKAANDEQRSMLDHARRSPHIVIQGPPGTGKTHTIANLVAVLLAEGRRVLVTAENDRALQEVQSKLPDDMQPLLIPLLKDKANSGLSRSVAAIVEAADQAARGARRDREVALVARRERLDADANDTIRQIRNVDDLEGREHDLNGQRMRLAGHLIALDSYRDDLAAADQYLTGGPAQSEGGDTLLELHDHVTDSDRELADLRLPTGLPAPPVFAQHLRDLRDQLAALPERGSYNLATIDARIIQRLTQILGRLERLPAVPYRDITLTLDGYRDLGQQAARALTDLNHGVTVSGTTAAAGQDWLAAYLDLPGHYRIDPAALHELHRRTRGVPPAAGVQLDATANPVAGVDQATELASAFVTDPSGLLSSYVADLRTRRSSRFDQLASDARLLAAQATVPPTLPVAIADGAPALHELLQQAMGLRDHLRDGGKMTRRLGPTPARVKAAQPLIDHVTVGGSRVDTFDEAAAVIAWLSHRIAIETARNWAAQHDLPAPAADAAIHDWLQAVANLPTHGTEVNRRIDDLIEHCHVTPEARAATPDVLVNTILAAASERIRTDLDDYIKALAALEGGSVRVDGRPVHNEATADVAHRHLNALHQRQVVADQLPAAWTATRDLHDATGDDPLQVACLTAAVLATVPGGARPQTLSAATIRRILDGAIADRRRDEMLTAHSKFIAGIRSALTRCTPASPATVLLEQAVDQEDPAAYRDAHAAHVDEVERARRAIKLRDATERLNDAHPALIAAFLTGDSDTHPILANLDHYQQIVTYRQQVHAILDRYPDVRALHRHLGKVRTQQQKVEAELASERCWWRAVERLVDDRKLASALSSLQKAERAVPKTLTAKSYQRKLRALRAATKEAAPAIPCWVMSIDKVAELLGYPTGQDRFDVVIVDEASQAWFPAAFLYAIADQVIVVGDDLQTSPADTSVPHDEMVRLVRDHIPDHRLVNALDGEFSLYDIAAAITAPTVMVDHFRCVPPIIELSNGLCYAQRGRRLLPVRVTDPDGLAPIRHVNVPDGRRASKAGANSPEVDMLVAQVASCVADPAYTSKTFGVIVVGSNPEAHTKQLRHRLLEALGPDQMAARQIEVGSPAQYQGAERDVVFLSLVAAPDDVDATLTLWPHELTGRNLRRVQALNVAVSRARDQLWIFHSFTSANLKPGDVRHVLLSPPALTDDDTVASQLARCDTDFERDVVTALAAHPDVARIQTQVEALGYHIDIVIESHDRRRLAIECDGDRWHTSNDAVARDLYRQRTLETLGWKFHRFLASEWCADPDGVLNDTMRALGAAPQRTTTTSRPHREEATPAHKPPSPAATEDADDADGQADDVAPIAPAATGPRPPATVLAEPARATATVAVAPTDIPDQPDQPEEKAPQPASEDNSTSEPRRDQKLLTPAAFEDLAAVHATPAPYQPWDTAIPLPHPLTGKVAQGKAGIRRIVEVEGPILGERLYQQYVRSAGGSKVGPAIRRKLNSLTYQMVTNGDLVADDPLDEGGQIPKTFRLPDQPPIAVRELGERTLHHVPPLELAARIRTLRQPGDSEEETFRRVLKSYGLTKLTAATRTRLDKCASLVPGV